MGQKDENIDDDLDMEGLSDEERAALEDDDDESEILKNIAGGADDDADEDEEDGDDNASSGDGDDDAGADDDDDVAAVADDAAGDSKPTENSNAAEVVDDKSPPVAAEFQPEFRAQIPEGLADKITALDTRTTELLQKFNDGEIELPEFLTQKSEIDSERLQLTLAQKQAEWAQSQNEDARAQRWKWEQERFFGQKSSEIYKGDEVLLGALNAAVIKLRNSPEHSGKPMSFFIDEADRQVRQRFNIAGSDKATDKVKETKQRREPDTSKLPKTLANLPAADVAETGADEFAYLDKLDGIALEQALRKLTPEQEARYLGVSA